jgi:cytochrome c2
MHVSKRGTPREATRPTAARSVGRAFVLRCSALLLIGLPFLAVGAGAGTRSETRLEQRHSADFVETNFPFFSSVLDARELGKDWPQDNLTPRGLILNLGLDCWACFDTELLRMSLIWEGKGITPAGMAQGSYHKVGHKAPDGQEQLPRIIGLPWIATGVYPGWQIGQKVSLIDVREPGRDKREVGRGPLPENFGRFKAVRLSENGLCLEYNINGTSVREWVTASILDGKNKQVERRFHLENVREHLWLLFGKKPVTSSLHVHLIPESIEGKAVSQLIEENGLIQLKIEPSDRADFTVLLSQGALRKQEQRAPNRFSKRHWPKQVTTQGKLSNGKEAFVLDDIPLPLANPENRNVRLADIAFFRNGEAAAVTFDGDVWKISGLKGDLTQVHWQRFASGLHEPLSLCIRDEQLFIFDRNGIWRLKDEDGDGETDIYELFSNCFTQTAETREFANSMKLAPDGAFIIAKGGQQNSSLGKHNGSVLRISRDGKDVTVLGWGLRQPFIGVQPQTGLITASDQQGHYIPATPLHIIGAHQYYGFLSSLLPKEKYPAAIAEPLTWIPHPVNASGATQVWLAKARMGPLNDALVHIGYNRPELFLVRMNSRASVPQAAIVNLAHQLDFAPLNGCVNPADGQLYLTGFQIWGSTAKRVSGLARLRYTGLPNTLPREIAPMDKGILLRFDVALDAKGVEPSNFSVERWNYKRTANYGSPHFKCDGTPGQDWMTPSSAYLSQDARSVFIGIPDMKPVMQMRIGWALATETGAHFEQNAYFTPRQLTEFVPEKEGFAPVNIDLTPRTSKASPTPVTAEEGEKLSALMGCTACHASDNNNTGKVGPSWKGLFGKERQFKAKEPAIADEAYLRKSILDPSDKVVLGFEKNDSGMPSYAGVLTDSQIEALVLYIKTLK